MRIIAGNLKGRVFESPHSAKTHPMSDKVRGALFTMLGDIGGMSVLDAFAGSGALSFEAISRGAARAVALDSDRSAQQCIMRNIGNLGLARQVKLIKASASAWLSTTEDSFDIVLLDPPFNDPQPKLLMRLAERARHDGIAAISLPPTVDFCLLEGYQLLARKSYGDASLAFYRRIA